MGILFLFYSVVCFSFLSQSHSSSSLHHLCSPTQASALLHFKQPFQIYEDYGFTCETSFPKTTSWNESRDCCTWDGVTCDLLTGHVIGLDLSCSHLIGNIHPNSSLFQLHHLQTLNLAYNYFYSSIPNGFGRLRNLRHLNLSNSYFNGKIPTEISYLSNLVSLDLSFLFECELDQKTFEILLQNFTNLEVVSLSNVNISSPIPMNLSSSLRYVDLEDTNLQGVLTESLFLLPKLERFNLGWNHLLKGVLPNSIGTLSSLNHLGLQRCDLSGSIPDSIGNLTQLRELDFSGNYFAGHIPDSIGNLTQLRGLHFGGNNFTGHIPYFINNLTQLWYLGFSGNDFTGHIPDSIGNLTQLRKLYISGNNFTGHIPSTVSNLKRLTYLDLSSNSLGGNIPDVFSNLQELVVLRLSRNSFIGPFPSSILSLGHLDVLDLSSNNITSINESTTTFSSLTTLQLSSCELKDFPHFLRNLKTLKFLDLSNNKIHGPIPNWFRGMRWDSLIYLNLSHNSLTGHLQHSHYYKLKYLDLKFNFLQGQLPSSICNMSSLEFLDLSRNNFSESVPHCLGSMNWLEVLDLRMNNFSGSLPPFCTQSTSLRTIVLNGNRFEGPVHVSLLNCVGLEVLDMGNNDINDTFPSWLGALPELQVLILKSNKFHGPISTQKKFFFPRLRIFDLSHNEFSGSLPAEFFLNFKAMIKNGMDKGHIRYMKASHSPYGTYEDSVTLVIKGNNVELERISTIMTTIDLSSNHFEGVIPKTLKDLGSLWLLNLSHNNLIRDIPMELGQLHMLEALDLSWNRLTGKIPQELTRLTFLAKLNLSQNLLVGRIPQGPQFNTFENDSYGGNLGLCGPPLSKQCITSYPSHVPQPLESDEEDDSYFVSGFTWESVVIGYSCGLVVGTVIWSLMFKARKPKWVVEFLEGAFPKKMRRPQKRRLRQRT